jgi:hypothetical protein
MARPSHLAELDIVLSGYGVFRDKVTGISEFGYKGLDYIILECKEVHLIFFRKFGVVEGGSGSR